MKNWIRQLLTLALFLAIGLGAGFGVQQWRESGAAAARIGSVDRSTPGLPAAERVVLVSLSTCPACASAREWLREQGQAHLELAVDKSDDARQLADRLGVDAVPVLIVGSRRIDGFDADTYARVLAEQQPSS